MIVHNLADITGDGAAHALTSDQQKAKWLSITADPDNSAPVRVGGIDTASGVGVPVAPGGSFYFPTISDYLEFYPLSQIYYYAASGDKIYVAWATEGSNV